jgi:hypothetical protein
MCTTIHTKGRAQRGKGRERAWLTRFAMFIPNSRDRQWVVVMAALEVLMGV